MAWIARASVPDAGAFLTRVIRLDPAALVRLRPLDDAVALWARLPFEVLVSRGVRGEVPDDRTVRADALLASLTGSGALPPRRDTDWRWPLPPVPGRVVERLPATEVARLSAAAASTVRAASAEGIGGRAVGSRALRDALLDHVPIVVTTDEGERVDVSQRLIQAVARMSFLPADLDKPLANLSSTSSMSGPDFGVVEVRVAGPWVGLIAPYGNAWHRPPLLLR